MRLLHVTATHLNFSGGIPVVLRDLVNAQNKIKGLEARVLSIKEPVLQTGSPYFDSLENQPFETYIQNFCPNIVVFHSHYYFEYLKFYKMLVKLKIPYFIEPHGSFGQAALRKSKYKKLIANRFILYPFMKKAKGYIFLNEREKADSRYHTGCDLIIPNGINAVEIDENYISKKDWSFYFIGRYDINHKGLDYLFDALDILEYRGESVKIELYGTGSARNTDYINQRIAGYRTLQVTNCGPLYGVAQKNTLEKHGIMVLTSRYEGFPMTILEAWRYGNPCLVTKGTNVMDEVIAEALGWGTELESEKIANALLLAKNDYANARELYIRRCKTYVKNTYSWEQIALASFHKLSEICDKGE